MHNVALLRVTLLFYTTLTLSKSRANVGPDIFVNGVNKTSDFRYEIEVEKSDILHIIRSTLEPHIQMYMDHELMASFNYTVACQDMTSNYIMTVKSNNRKILRVPETKVIISCGNATAHDTNLTSNTDLTDTAYVVDGSLDVKLMSGNIGYDHLEFTLSDETPNSNETETEQTESYDVRVIRKLRPVDRIFRVVVYCVQVLVLCGFGAKLDFKVVKETLRKPIAPGIGFCCQYIMMPLVSIQRRFNVDATS